MITNLSEIALKRILIVEDDLIIALSTEKMVERLGHEVVERVTTGEEAVKAACSSQPDLILMDIRLAGEMDGIDATRLIKEDMPDVKVVYLTGNTDPVYRQRAEGTGYEAYLIKPIAFHDLKEIVA